MAVAIGFIKIDLILSSPNELWKISFNRPVFNPVKISDTVEIHVKVYICACEYMFCGLCGYIYVVLWKILHSPKYVYLKIMHITQPIISNVNEAFTYPLTLILYSSLCQLEYLSSLRPSDPYMRR